MKGLPDTSKALTLVSFRDTELSSSMQKIEKEDISRVREPGSPCGLLIAEEYAPPPVYSADDIWGG